MSLRAPDQDRKAARPRALNGRRRPPRSARSSRRRRRRSWTGPPTRVHPRSNKAARLKSRLVKKIEGRGRQGARREVSDTDGIAPGLQDRTRRTIRHPDIRPSSRHSLKNSTALRKTCKPLALGGQPVARPLRVPSERCAVPGAASGRGRGRWRRAPRRCRPASRSGSPGSRRARPFALVYRNTTLTGLVQSPRTIHSLRRHEGSPRRARPGRATGPCPSGTGSYRASPGGAPSGPRTSRRVEPERRQRSVLVRRERADPRP